MESAKPFWQNGPAPGVFYNFPGKAIKPQEPPITRTRTPITTGGTVIGIHIKDGVMIAADTLGSYGSLARFKSVDRVIKVNNKIILGAGGDYADFQYLRSSIEQKILDEECLDDGFVITPKSLHCWLTHVMYNKRSKFDPLWNDLVIAGLDNDKPFLGCVDKLGTAYVSRCVATGFGNYLIKPLIETEYEKNPEMTEEEALKCIQKAMELTFYRDCRSYPRYTVGVITKDKGIQIKGPYEVSGYWEAATIGSK